VGALSHPAFAVLCSVPTAVDLVLAGFGEVATDGRSMFQMQLDGAGLLDLAAAIMCSASSTNPAREITGQWRRCLWHDWREDRRSFWKIRNSANWTFGFLFGSFFFFQSV
jgi:hypothetical protein